MLTPEIIELEAMTIIGMQSLISMKCNLIPQLWDRFMSRENEIKNRAEAPKAAFGVSYDMRDVSSEGEKSVYEFFHLVGTPASSVEHIPEGMSYKQIPAHKYAKFTHNGSLAGLQKTYDAIFSQWLPQSGYEYDASACDLEWYDERFKIDSDESEFDIYVPIT